MSTLMSGGVLLLLLCASGSVHAQSAPISEQLTGAPHIVVTAETAQRAQEVRISPGHALMLVFDTPVRREDLRVDEGERFRELSLSEDGLLLSLLPSKEIPLGMRFGLRVTFADGNAPASLDFTLVVSPQSEAQIEVYRQPRPIASYQREAEATQALLLQCQSDLQKERVGHAQPPGLLGLLALNLMSVDGVHGQDITRALIPRQGESFKVRMVSSYRTITGKAENPMMRLAVDVHLRNNGLTPWHPTHARLVGSTGQWKAEVWAPTPMAPGERGRVVVEVERPGGEAPGTYVLELWDEEGQQMMTLSGVTFP